MRIRDKYIDLRGFLEGSDAAPFRWVPFALAGDPSASEWTSIEQFRTRAREFLLNVKDLNLGVHRQIFLRSDRERVQVFDEGYPGRFRAKSIYLDFRHFVANKEPSKFERVVNVLLRYAQEELAKKFLIELKFRFANAERNDLGVGGARFPLSMIVDTWFNTELFHAGDDDQKSEREKWLKIVEDESIHRLIFWSVVGAEHEIKTLYACLKDVERDGRRTAYRPDSKILNEIWTPRV